MRKTFTVSLSPEMAEALDLLAAEEGISRSDAVRESVKHFIFLRKFRRLRARMARKAKTRGVFTDEDVFERVS